MDATHQLNTYKSKRNFAVTPEPADGGGASEILQFVVQKHWASSLHYDFRLELNGVMKSWAVPKGPSFDPTVKRMAVQVEDHPIAYARFEGIIPAKQYGAGKVIVWDKGHWLPMGDPHTDYEKGNLKFELVGLKLRGKWVLVRMKGKGEKQAPWLLIKEKDVYAKSSQAFSVVDEYPDSVSGNDFPEMISANHSALQYSAELSVEEILKKATKADLPDHLNPQLATLSLGLSKGADQWLYEIKFDGYRILIRVDHQSVKLFTRNGHDWTSKLTFLQQEIAKLNWPSGWYDGEIVVQNAAGIPDFGALQKAFESNKLDQIVLYLFDVVYFNGFDLRTRPLSNRRLVLIHLLESKASAHIRLSETFNASSDNLLKSACQLGIEGIMAKRADSPYVCRRSADWLKLKCKQQQEFIIIGYTSPNGLRTDFGALLLGVYDAKGALMHVGNVGSGFNQYARTTTKQALDAIVVNERALSSQFTAPPKTTWVKPLLVAEVEFGGWTQNGHIRHGVFKGLRMDKSPHAIVLEQAKNQLNDNSGIFEPPTKSTINITHSARVIDPSSGITKLELVRYYQLVGELMMPHLKQRPVSFLRAPSGLKGELFFQKHAETEKLQGVKKVAVKNMALTDNMQPLIEIANKAGLVSSAQWNVIEFHTHNGNLSLDLPDRMIFDLDPGEHVQWLQMQEAAQLMQAFLSQLNLPAFLKTSGGKGLHIVVPIKKKYDWDTVKAFTQALVMHMSHTIPSRFVAKSGPKNRIGKIFIDYLRNAQEATTICAWSLRARTGMGVSVPVAWAELSAIKSGDHWHLRNVHTRLDQGNNPWKSYHTSAADITDAIAALSP